MITGENQYIKPLTESKNQTAVSLGELGGLKGGKAIAEKTVGKKEN